MVTLKTLALLFTAIAIASLVASCSKDDEDDELEPQTQTIPPQEWKDTIVYF